LRVLTALFVLEIILGKPNAILAIEGCVEGCGIHDLGLPKKKTEKKKMKKSVLFIIFSSYM